MIAARRRADRPRPQAREEALCSVSLPFAEAHCDANGELDATAFTFGGEEFLLLTFPIRSSNFDRLTHAEKDVAHELLRGKSYRDIARRRGTTSGTVANQVRSIFRKLGIRSRSELARTAGA